jgi:hypothetical protein
MRGSHAQSAHATSQQTSAEARTANDRVTREPATFGSPSTPLAPRAITWTMECRVLDT